MRFTDPRAPTDQKPDDDRREISRFERYASIAIVAAGLAVLTYAAVDWIDWLIGCGH